MGSNIPLDPAISYLRFYSTNKFAKDCVPEVYIYTFRRISVTKLKIGNMVIDEGLVIYSIFNNGIVCAVKKNKVDLCVAMERCPK